MKKLYEALPEVNITLNGNQLKVYDDKNIYLKDGSNFELSFNNPTFDNYKAEIFINGKKQKQDLVLSPKSNFKLDRFVDKKRKFKFEVYDVDDNPEVKSIIKNNGHIKVIFYKQKVVNYWTYSGTTMPCSGSVPVDYSPWITVSSGIYGTPKSTNFANTNQQYYSSTITSEANKTEFESKIETGRISEGKKSKQKFNDIHMDFELYPTVIYEYQLYPDSIEPRFNSISSELTIDGRVVKPSEIRTYCPECGRRIKKNWKYCAGCGYKV